MPNAGTLHHCTRGTFVKFCAKISKAFAVRMHLHEVEFIIISVLFWRRVGVWGGKGRRCAPTKLNPCNLQSQKKPVSERDNPLISAGLHGLPLGEIGGKTRSETEPTCANERGPHPPGPDT